MILRVEGLDKLVAKFEQMPDEVADGLRAALKISVREVQEYARDHHRFKTRGGDTERGIISLVDGAAMQGVVTVSTAVGRYQHEGTGIYGPRGQPIVIKPRNGLALRWPVGGGAGYQFAKRVTVKGIKPDPFLYNALEAKRPEIISRFEATVRRIVSD